MEDPDGSSFFDNTLIAFGSNIQFGHDQRYVPSLIAGHGGGKLNHGQYHVFESKQTALADLWLGMLHQVGF